MARNANYTAICSRLNNSVPAAVANEIPVAIVSSTLRLFSAVLPASKETSQ
jgi:hypothetical protein